MKAGRRIFGKVLPKVQHDAEGVRGTRVHNEVKAFIGWVIGDAA